MNQYDFIFLLDEEKKQEELKKFISTLSGKITEEKTHGKKNLAYEIKKVSQAYLYEWIIEIDTDKISEFKKKLGFEKTVLRYLMFKKNLKSKITNNK
jgi:ribosomal protein S6